MAVYTITHNCEHQITHQLFGTVRERDSKADWFAKKDCLDCRYTRRASLAAASSAGRGLSALSGTEKQVKWGTQLREEFAEKLETAKGEWLSGFTEELAGTPETLDKALEVVLDLVSGLEARLQEWTSAKEWIDARIQASPDTQLHKGFLPHKPTLEAAQKRSFLRKRPPRAERSRRRPPRAPMLRKRSRPPLLWPTTRAPLATQ
jgi:hypothetical protein